MVPGNRVVIGLSGDVPQAAAIIKAISERLVAAGIEPANITLLQAPATRWYGIASRCGFGGCRSA